MSKNKKAKKKRTKGFGWRVAGIVVASIIGVVLICTIAGSIGNTANVNFIKGLDKITVDDPLEKPYKDTETGYWTFECDRDFRILQFTDVHIGGGFMSLGKDSKAINAVYDIVSHTKPDLVVITGDLVYPVPFQSGSFNNLTPAKIISSLLEQMGIYWTFAYGNHDTEVYSYYDREELTEFYTGSGFQYCLFERGPEDVDGYGNNFINVVNSEGIITQSIITIDSHSYAKGFFQDYDNIHENQVAWYEKEIKRLDGINRANGATETFKSLAFFHIPLKEYQDAYDLYKNNGYQSTADAIYHWGKAGEPGEKVYHGIGDDQVFEKMLELGSTQGVFTGHDHYNNYSIEYKGIRLTYGMSIDYLAYPGIVGKTAQRGGTVIDIGTDGSIKDLYGVRLVDHHEIRNVGDYEK